MKNDKQVKSSQFFLWTGRQRIRLSVLIFLLSTLLVSGLFILSGLTPGQIVLALTGNYAKGTGDQLSTTDWNMLDDDFVARSGGAASNMSGNLDMNNQLIVNLQTPTNPTDAVNRSYVDAQIAGVTGGGSVFTNWGRADCPSGSSVLYSGIAFGTKWDEPGGSGDVFCVDDNETGAFTATRNDKLWPVSLGQTSYIPGGYTEQRKVRCAVCYRDGGTCYQTVGAQTCAAGFTASSYSGYMFGGVVNTGGVTTNKNERYCVNSNFTPDITSTVWGSVWYGTVLADNTNVASYSVNSFLRCGVCCN